MDVESALTEYDIGSVRGLAQVGGGHIHRTWRVDTDRGSYVLQRLHDVISDAAVADMAHVAAYVSARGIQVPMLTSSKKGTFVVHADGARWRLYPWIEGEVFVALKNPAMAEEAGRLLAKLHSILKSSPYQPTGSIPHFHDTEYILSELRSVADRVPTDLREIQEHILTELPKMIVRDEGGPVQLIHGDPKISNFIFSKNGAAVGSIDFDTILIHRPTIDIGDALRSWCNKTSEDDPNATCDEALYDASIRGLASLNPLPPEVYQRAFLHITFELTARFLTDVVRDNYFGWDATRYASRVEHNSVRARGQYALATSLAQLI